MDRQQTLTALKMDKQSVSIEVGTHTITIETGYMAKQAAGSVVVRCGETMVLSTVCDGDPRPGQNFFPLMVDYREKIYAAGRIPGNFFRREQRPSDHETLTSRLTDRPLRPLFPEGYMRDTNVQGWVISHDQSHESDILSMVGASAALCLSPIPFNGPIGAVRIGLVDDAFVVNPTYQERQQSSLDLIVAGTTDAITMVEAGAQELPEARMVEALVLAHEQIKRICAAINELVARSGKAKVAYQEPTPSPWIAKILETAGDDIRAALNVIAKQERYAALKACKQTTIERMAGDDEALVAEISAAFGAAKDHIFRELILEGKRVDGRDTKTVRPIVIDLDLLPRAHGSALFTRGETQGLVTCTLGTAEDEQMVDGIYPKRFDKFLLHYNFPGFSVGETGGRPGPGRREIGHGALARRALTQVLPSDEVWPYTLRLVSEILESNGSSSMASVCGGSLAMMAAGVPISAPVAGIAMGLVKEGERYAVLTDILGDEDHYGDMDFKVCGTDKGITALQMDIKIAGISADLMAEALEQARTGRLHILGVMNEAISTHRDQLSPYAPQIVQVQIDPEFIGKIIGKGGETIRRIQEETGAKLNIDDDGIITIASPDMSSIERAKGWISDLTELPEEGRVYSGTITSIKEFGAFVEFIPGTEGLVHISEWDHRRTDSMEGVARTGEKIEVKLIEVDARTGRFRLSRKALLPLPEGFDPAAEAVGAGAGDGERRPPRRDGDRRPPRRDGDRRPRRDH